MKELKGEFWEQAESGIYDGLVCTTNQIVKKNGELVMGGGIAKEFYDKMPELGVIWGDMVSNGHKSVMFTYYGEDAPAIISGKYAIALPTKEDWKNPSPEWLVIQSCKEMLFVANCLGLGDILMPRPGCGLGGLIWDNVKTKLDFLDDRFKVISNV